MGRCLRSPLVVIIPALLLLSAGCEPLSEANTAEKEDNTVLIPVEVAPVIRGSIEATYRGTATIEAAEEARVVAKVGGIVEEILVEEGDRVKAGQALARLDAERLRLEAARAKANLDKLSADFKRNEAMFQKKLISLENFERMQFELSSQQTEYQLAQLTLKESTVLAPISGIVSQRLIKVGNMITTNEPTFHITQLDRLQAVVHVPEREIAKLGVGQTVTAIADVWPDERFTGHIERINPVVDANTGTVRVTVAIDDASRRLRPGMFARLGILYDRRENTLLAPRETVLTEDTESVVFVITDNIAKRTVIQTGFTDGEHAEITDGVAEGDQVVITGHTTLKDGTQVEIVNNNVPG